MGRLNWHCLLSIHSCEQETAFVQRFIDAAEARDH